MGGGGVNIKKVAEMAGVSVATISRVLNHPELVMPETRSRVLAVMEQANYMPNWFARGLSLGRTNTIAVLMPGAEYSTYLKIMSGIEMVARNHKYAVFLCHTHHRADIEADYIRMVVERNVDGVILTSSTLTSEKIAPLVEFEIPFVHIGQCKLEGCDHVCYINYESGAHELTTHMARMGHRRIDLLLDEDETPEAEQISVGFRRALAAARFEAGEVHTAENSVRGGFITAQRLLEEGNLPQALITANDEQSFGVIKAMTDAGVDMPQELALACMNDSTMCSIVTPPLTGVELPAMRLGMAAARMMFDIIDNQGYEPEFPQEIILKPKLKIRQSCGNTKYTHEMED